ncbi:MAG: thermonuclease family protein [Alphaproteobacteria bacterium]
MTSKGLLTILGQVDIGQFWPATKGNNSSDGDTVHMKVDPATAFIFRSPSSTKLKHTTVFTGAYVNDHGKKKNVITSKSEIKIRLQGIDTPELHYPVIATWHPSKKGKFGNEFRQTYGAGAANALHAHLKAFTAGSSTIVQATFQTQIDRPQQAIDSHGRFVGDILVGTAAAKSINTWLVENGWAYPMLYDSMTAQEVATIIAAWKAGKAIAGRAGKAFDKALRPFDPSMNVNNAKLPDGGKTNFPKIFRRQATFWAGVAGPLTASEFVAAINKGAKGKTDKAYATAYFLKNADKLDRSKRVTLASQIGAQGQTKFSPDELVFSEDPSTLYDSGGTPIKTW